MTTSFAQATGTTTAALVASVRGLAWEAIPAEARLVARHCLLDFLGCAVAGAGDPLVSMLVAETAAREHALESSLIGRDGRATCASAALVNGAAAHALDYDDTHTTMMGHPSVPVLPAVLALAEAEGASGQRMIEAFVAGFELECRLGAVLGPAHYAAGFHSTATVGSFGAAAAAAQLLGLDEDGWLRTLGLAGAGAAGLKASFGTMAKPLHAGRAATLGVQSALLARRGFTAATSIVEAAQGFAATHGGSAGDSAWLASMQGRFFVRETLFKYHAACYLTHAAIEAALRIRRAHRVAAEAVRDVEVRASPAVLGVCNIAKPATGLELKFSLRGTVAMALLGEDTAAPGSFRDEVARAPRLQALRDRVHVTVDDALVPTASVVSVTTGRGRFEEGLDTGAAAEDLEEQGRRLEQKFRALASPVLGDARVEKILAMVATIEDQPRAADLLALTRVS